MGTSPQDQPFLFNSLIGIRLHSMGQPSEEASNALIYCTFAAFLVCGLAISWKLRGQSKGQWLSANRTQKGLPLALNFIATGECALKSTHAVA